MARSRLATRITLVALTVAFIAVLIAGLVSLGLVRGAAQDQARSSLARQADLVATTLDRTQATGAARRNAVTTLLRRQQVQVDVVGPGQQTPGYLEPGDVAALEAGQDLSVLRTRAGGAELLVE